MADIGKKKRVIDVEPMRVPERRTLPAQPEREREVPVPLRREKVPA